MKQSSTMSLLFIVCYWGDGVIVQLLDCWWNCCGGGGRERTKRLRKSTRICWIILENHKYLVFSFQLNSCVMEVVSYWLRAKFSYRDSLFFSFWFLVFNIKFSKKILLSHPFFIIFIVFNLRESNDWTFKFGF